MTDRNSDMRHILSQVRTMTGGTVSPLEEARVAVWSGATITVLRNPSAAAFHKMVEKAEGTLRGLLSDDGTDLFVWDAYMAVHPNIQQELGLGNYDCIAYSRGKWRGPVDALNSEQYKVAVERVTPKPGPTPEQKRRDDELLQAIFDDPDFAKLMGEGVEPVVEDERSDDAGRDQTEAAFEAVRDFLSRNADNLADVLQPVRQGDFCIRGSKVGLARDLVIVFTHSGHSGIGTAGGNEVILIRCLRGPGDLKYLDTRFGTGGHDTFVHEYAHYLSQGKGYTNSVADYEERGESAYYNNSEEVHAIYVESTAGFRRLMRSLIEYAPPEILENYRKMTDQQLYDFMIRSCVKKDFIDNLEPEARRRFDKRSIRFINQTIRPLLANRAAGSPST